MHYVNSNREKSIDETIEHCQNCGAAITGIQTHGPAEHSFDPCGCPTDARTIREFLKDGPSLVADGSGYVWDHADCHEAYCEGDLQQQDQFNVMCLDCKTVWTHYKDEKQHELMTPDHEVVATKARAIADGGSHEALLQEATLVNLTGFQRDVLWALSHEGPSKGTALNEYLNEYYGREVTIGQLYPNLDELADAGYIDKRQRDRRTNEYSLTERARQALSNRQAWERGELA